MQAVEARISKLQLRPLKGGGHIDLDHGRMTKSGFETSDGRIKDHSLVVVTREVDNKKDHNFFTQRERLQPDNNVFVRGTSQLALAKPEIRDGKLAFVFNGKSEVKDPGEENDNPKNVRSVQVWEYRGGAIEVPLLSEWLSDNLDLPVYVMRTTGPWDRMAKQNFMPNDNPLLAQDGYPIHTVSQEDVNASFESINETPDVTRYRPQIVLAGLPNRSIHDYEFGEVNGVGFSQPKPCDRCEVTGIDQETGDKRSPIKPLVGIEKAGFPRWVRTDSGNEGRKVVIMGENWLPHGDTELKIGNTVTLIRHRQTPLTFAQ